MKRSSISLPDSVYSELSYLAERLGVSRSAIVADVLSQTLPPMGELLRSIPDNPTEGDALRFRGESAKVIREKLNNLRDMSDDLFTSSRISYDSCADRPSGCSCDYSSGERVAPAYGCLVHGGPDGE